MKARGKHSSHCGALPLSESKVRTDQSVPVELTMSWSWAHHKVRVAGKKEECVQMVAALRSFTFAYLFFCTFLPLYPPLLSSLHFFLYVAKLVGFTLASILQVSRK